ncbi:MAG: hypothetical protein F4X47_06050 [Gammaproteobacteria bacterium]|nr:hypothetical protein [Gammaproteobacteria bacterium]
MTGARVRSLAVVRGPARGLLQLMLMALSAAPAAGQMPLTVEVRGGGVYSTPFARGIAVVPAELEAVARDLEVGPRPAPVAELVLAARPGPALVLELRAGASIADVTGAGGGNSWPAGRMTAVHIVGGVRYPLSPLPGADVRVGAGKVLYLSSDVNLLEGSGRTGVLLSGGFGYRLPGPFAAVGVAEAQWHEFAPAPLAEAGAAAGAVTRFLAYLAVPVWGTP